MNDNGEIANQSLVITDNNYVMTSMNSTIPILVNINDRCQKYKFTIKSMN